MQNGSSNIYQTARKAAGLTQEAAAERLALSVESLRAYETGQRIPGNDIVARMCAVYDTQFRAFSTCSSPPRCCRCASRRPGRSGWSWPPSSW